MYGREEVLLADGYRGDFGFCRPRSAMDWAADVVRCGAGRQIHAAIWVRDDYLDLAGLRCGLSVLS